MRAGHCPNCKEPTPPGADYCPICGEDLNWQTVDGQKISKGNAGRAGKSFARKLVRNLILLASLALLAMVAFVLRERWENSHPIKPQASATPRKGSTPSSGEDVDSMLDNSLGGNDNAATESADNAVSNSVENSVSNSAGNETSDKGSTPSAKETPLQSDEDVLSDLDMP